MQDLAALALLANLGKVCASGGKKRSLALVTFGDEEVLVRLLKWARVITQRVDRISLWLWCPNTRELPSVPFGISRRCNAADIEWVWWTLVH